MVATTIATTMALHITGVTRFELPLRGESFGAWLNSLSMVRRLKSQRAREGLAENRAHLVPQRRILAVAIRLRRRRLRDAYGIGCRKAVDQTSFQFVVCVPV